MANNIKWLEIKENNYRGNYTSMCFMVDNSKFVFAYNAYMTYRTFKLLTRKFAQAFRSSTVKVFEDKGQSNMTLSSRYDDQKEIYKFTFFNEIPVGEGEIRKFIYFKESDIFNNKASENSVAGNNLGV